MNTFLQQPKDLDFQTPQMIFQDKQEIKQYYIFSKTKYIIIKQESEQQQKYIHEYQYILPNDKIFYTPKKFTNFIQTNLKIKLQFLYQVEAILGIISDKNQSFLILLEQSQKIGQIFQHEILKAESFKLLQLRMDLQTDIKDKQFSYIKNYFENELRNYLFSYTYNLDKTLQMNMLKLQIESRLNFVINKQLLKNIYHLTQEKTSFYQNSFIRNWTINLINGYFNSYLFEEAQMIFEIIILTRRETSNLGTRFNRRGLNDKAFAANFVEVEQIVINKTLSNFKNPICSSYVQIRASVPLYWYQNIKTFDPKPKIKINKYSETFHAFRIHLSDLCQRYGPNIQICNLLFSKSNPSATRKTEITLNEKFQEYFKQYFQTLKGLNMINYDIKKSMKEKKNVYQELKQLHSQTNQDIGFFLFTKYQNFKQKQNLNYIQTQKGIIRSNCVDCIDRTNIAQTIFSRIILEKQIKHLIFFKNKKEKLFIDIQLHLEKNFLMRLEKFWREIGDQIAQHYAGSKAHDINSTGKTGIVIKRYLCNVFGDDYKQKFLNLLQNNFEESSNEFVLSQSLLNYSLDNDKILKSSIKTFNNNFNKFQQYKQKKYYLCTFKELCKVLQIKYDHILNMQQQSLQKKIKSIKKDIQKLQFNKLNQTLQNIEKTNEFKNTYDQQKYNITMNNDKIERKGSFQKVTKRKTNVSVNKKKKKQKLNKFSSFFKRAEKFQPFSNFSQRNYGQVQKIEIEDFLEECDKISRWNNLKKVDLLEEMKELENAYKKINNQFYNQQKNRYIEQLNMFQGSFYCASQSIMINDKQQLKKFIQQFPKSFIPQFPIQNDLMFQIVTQDEYKIIYSERIDNKEDKHKIENFITAFNNQEKQFVKILRISSQQINLLETDFKEFINTFEVVQLIIDQIDTIDFMGYIKENILPFIIKLKKQFDNKKFISLEFSIEHFDKFNFNELENFIDCLFIVCNELKQFDFNINNIQDKFCSILFRNFLNLSQIQSIKQELKFDGYCIGKQILSNPQFLFNKNGYDFIYNIIKEELQKQKFEFYSFKRFLHLILRSSFKICRKQGIEFLKCKNYKEISKCLESLEQFNNNLSFYLPQQNNKTVFFKDYEKIYEKEQIQTCSQQIFPIRKNNIINDNLQFLNQIDRKQLKVDNKSTEIDQQSSNTKKTTKSKPSKTKNLNEIQVKIQQSLEKIKKKKKIKKVKKKLLSDGLGKNYIDLLETSILAYLTCKMQSEIDKTQKKIEKVKGQKIKRKKVKTRSKGIQVDLLKKKKKKGRKKKQNKKQNTNNKQQDSIKKLIEDKQDIFLIRRQNFQVDDVTNQLYFKQ